MPRVWRVIPFTLYTKRGLPEEYHVDFSLFLRDSAISLIAVLDRYENEYCLNYCTLCNKRDLESSKETTFLLIFFNLKGS